MHQDEPLVDYCLLVCLEPTWIQCMNWLVILFIIWSNLRIKWANFGFLNTKSYTDHSEKSRSLIYHKIDKFFPSKDENLMKNVIKCHGAFIKLGSPHFTRTNVKISWHCTFVNISVVQCNALKWHSSQQFVNLRSHWSCREVKYLTYIESSKCNLLVAGILRQKH